MKVRMVVPDGFQSGPRIVACRRGPHKTEQETKKLKQKEKVVLFALPDGTLRSQGPNGGPRWHPKWTPKPSKTDQKQKTQKNKKTNTKGKDGVFPAPRRHAAISGSEWWTQMASKVDPDSSHAVGDRKNGDNNAQSEHLWSKNSTSSKDVEDKIDYVHPR